LTLLPKAPLGNYARAAEPDSASALLRRSRDKLADIADQGKWDLYLSGYIHHGRGTYTPERIAELNEKNAWGGGLGKTVRNANGDDESVYAFGMNDSHYQPQLMLGYAYQWVHPFPHTGLEVSVGLTPQLMSRRDYFGGIPFPIVLPLATIGTRGAKLMVSYVPRLSKNKGSGDVLFFFGRIELK
jgi:hypothetical protein